MPKYKSYQHYLRSSKWKTLRQCVMDRDDCQCQVCHSRDKLVVHHTNYDRRYNEAMEDLVTLCETCHNELHKLLAQYKFKDLKAWTESYIRIYSQNKKD